MPILVTNLEDSAKSGANREKKKKGEKSWVSVLLLYVLLAHEWPILFALYVVVSQKCDLETRILFTVTCLDFDMRAKLLQSQKIKGRFEK